MVSGMNRLLFYRFTIQVIQRFNRLVLLLKLL
jgi:hypothetical protein